MRVQDILVILVASTMLVFRRGLADLLIEAINNFRGGPPTPMHPSPANDGALLRKHVRKSEDKLGHF